MKKAEEISVLIIYTGGTIGMVHDPKTGSLVPIDFKHITRHVPVLSNSGFNLESVSFDPVKDSSDIDPVFWVRMAEIIEHNYDNYDGFVVLHGTDTMAYSASALSFMMENLTKPVIFTGSQLPIGLLRTDGRENLITSIEIAAARENEAPVVPEVCIYFDNKLTRGNRTTKMSAEHFDAFSSPNYPPLAEAGLHLKFNYNHIKYPKEAKKLIVHKTFDNNVAILKLFPGINRNFVQAVMRTEGLRALIIETFGSGNAPTYRWFLDDIKGFIRDGGIIFNVTQCHGGSVEMGLYETSREMLAAGVVSGKDITSEASVTKLMHLLGKYKNNKDVLKHLSKSLSGEMS
ncbi:MAG TPA: asparaginase [Bacteroidales bacterium]|jgi:L-asparaginase|nr:asparaginase [Bacteroidales bacterium]OQB62752.1 MAG: L-asparaginase 1 [Bacteroidetes bacterium ADurb.Bin145]HOU01984.1 asparaginase [Bacteroidales bacterium]HQG62321.1 asparaginase [Bacteroidales bacterium]HQK67731.1 asparaginase [Bacteroidales bacterium]